MYQATVLLIHPCIYYAFNVACLFKGWKIMASQNVLLFVGLSMMLYYSSLFLFCSDDIWYAVLFQNIALHIFLHFGAINKTIDYSSLTLFCFPLTWSLIHRVPYGSGRSWFSTVSVLLLLKVRLFTSHYCPCSSIH